jgi:hypothetical protein
MDKDVYKLIDALKLADTQDEDDEDEDDDNDGIYHTRILLFTIHA